MKNSLLLCAFAFFILMLSSACSASSVTRSFSSATVNQSSNLTVNLSVSLTGGETFYAIDEIYPVVWTVLNTTGDVSQSGHIKFVVIQNATNTIYTYKILSPNVAGVQTFSGIYMTENMSIETNVAGQTQVTVNADTTPPAISGVDSVPGRTTAVISWTTSEAGNSSVNYGTTISLGTIASDPASVTSHSVSLSSLGEGTLYYYNVKSCDSSGNCNTSSTQNFSTTAAPDTTPPNVSITSPANGATVSGIVNINATASDNVLVSYVQFYRNTTLISTDLTAPYGFAWNATAESNGQYSIMARAVDNSSNQATSTITVTVSNAPPDTTPPVRSNGQPLGNLSSNTTQATLSLTTNESATCKYSNVSGVAYASMNSTFSTTGGTSHSTLVTRLKGGSVSFYVRCIDQSGNANPDDFAISFFINYHKADTDQNGCVDMIELFNFITRWKVSNVDVNIRELIEAIGLWKKGC